MIVYNIYMYMYIVFQLKKINKNLFFIVNTLMQAT